VEPFHALGDLALLKANFRKNARYVLLADVTECYRSIYTHSIPWALHGKSVAKKNQKNTLLGNRIDKLVRNMQDRQTNGIPIGPDTSLIIGEIILSAVDARLNEILGPVSGFRYYDDYELSFYSHGEAEEASRALQIALADYNLQLNPSKTRIVELPQTLETPWMLDLRNFEFKNHRPDSRQRIIQFFDSAFSHRLQQRDAHILSYAIGRVERVPWNPGEWEVVQNLLFQSVSADPSAVQSFVTLLARAQVNSRSIDLESLSTVLNRIVEQNAASGNSSESAWALWGILMFQIKVTAKAALAISKTSDSFVAILALDAHRQGLFEDAIDTAQWTPAMSSTGLYDSQWLLAYEAAAQGWLLPSGGTGYIAQDSYFSHLLAASVRFYEPVQPPDEDTLKQLKGRKAKSYDEDTEDEDEDSQDEDDGEDEDGQDYEPPDDERDTDEDGQDYEPNDDEREMRNVKLEDL